MKTKLIIALQIVSLVAPVAVFAQTITPPALAVNINTVLLWITQLKNWIFTIIMAVAVLVLLVGAWNILTAGGDSAKVGTGKNWILYGIAGVIVAILSAGLLSLVCSFFSHTC